MKRVFIIFFVLISSCTNLKNKEQLSQDELNQLYLKAIENVRPILKSDEFRFMDCDEKKHLSLKKTRTADYKLWKVFGDLELRRQALEVGANILSLHHKETVDGDLFEAVAYSCSQINTTNEVVNVGMCKSSENKVFILDFDRELFRELGEKILIEKIKYHAIANHYKSYFYKNLKYSYTKQEFRAEASFYKCY